MLKKPNCPVIAIEEHYWDRELSATFTGTEGVRIPVMMDKLFDLGELRIEDMDEAGVDTQVISHGAPSAQNLTSDDAVALTRRFRLMARQGDRQELEAFRRVAALPTSDPALAADELDRTVRELGFKGAMINRALQRCVS